MNMHACPKFVPNPSSCLASFPHFGICDPLTPSKCPLGLKGLICLAYVHSVMNMYTCAKFGPDQFSGLEAFPDLLFDDPLTPCPSGTKGLIFSSCPFPDESVYVCQIWSRSVQWFGSFLRFMNLWPPNPPCPSGVKGLIFSSWPFPD